jgi:hypothetical protein
MAIKKVKLPDNTTVDINDARDVTFLDADGILRSVATEFRFIEDGGGSIAALPGQGDGSTEDYTLATTNEVIFKPGTGTNSVRNSKLTTAQSQASGTGGVSILGTSVGNYAVSAGDSCIANGPYSHVSGYNCITGGTDTSNRRNIGDSIAPGAYAHAEGDATIAQGFDSHAEGTKTFAVGAASHVEGRETEAKGAYSHAEGYKTVANGNRSHAEGVVTQTTNTSEHAEGQYNKSTSGTTLHSVGIGTSNSARKNAHEITTDGKHYILGVGGYDGTNVTTSGVQDLATVINSGIHEAVDSGSTTAGTWVATASGVTALTDGLTVKYKVTIAGGSATTTFNLNSLGAKTVYRFNTTKLTTHYAVGSTLLLYYNASLNSGCWMLYGDYDSTGVQVRIYPTTTNAEYDLLTRYNTTTLSTYTSEYSRFASGVTVNPSTKNITASGFKISGGTSSQVLTADGSTRSITISSSEPTSGTGSDGDIWIVI